MDQARPVVELGLSNFQKTGKALHEIRQRKLYRFEFGSWDQCCRQAWNVTKAHADRLIAAYELCVQLEPTGAVPENEHQARQLLSVPADQRAAAWEEALSEGASPTALERAVAKRRPRKRSAALKPLRIKVPGGTVVITPTRKDSDYTALLQLALANLAQRAELKTGAAA